MTHQDPTRGPTEPYCSNCGYSLLGLTESSKCPECGKPLVDILVRNSFPGRGGYRYQSRTRYFGLPLVAIAFGAAGGEKVGKPKGIIAIGDMPRGIIAVGGQSLGVVAIGGFACGGIAFGGFSLGVLGLGGFSAGVAAVGGFAAGLFTFGGMSFPLIRGMGGRVLYLWPW